MEHTITIPKRQSYCFKGGERFIPETEYYSLLIHDEHQQVVRRDFCLACWEQWIQSHPREYQRFGHWKSKVEARPIPPSSKIEDMFSLLKRLLQTPHIHEEEAFVLALFLERARYLILRQELEREGMVYILYEVNHQDEFLMVKKVGLSSIRVEKIQQFLIQKLY